RCRGFHKRRSPFAGRRQHNAPELLFLLAAFLWCHSLFADVSTPLDPQSLSKITFDQNLGKQLPLQTQFQDESGQIVSLTQFFNNKPVLLAFGYYECPMLCSAVLNGMVDGLQELKATAGKDFEIVFVSISHSEQPPLAAAKKRTYLKRYGRPAEDGWHFLTGSESSIRLLTQSAGFHYAYDPSIHQYAHPAGFLVTTSDGKISRYFSGVTYSGADLQKAIAGARSQEIGNPIQQFLLLCFHYNPVTGKYGAAILTFVRLCGIATLGAIAGTIIYFSKRQHRPDIVVASAAPDAKSRRIEAPQPEIVKSA
ncbi:MAG TPA: SCO family protein, partial [Verrucomicrobiae bacterium]